MGNKGQRLGAAAPKKKEIIDQAAQTIRANKDRLLPKHVADSTADALLEAAHGVKTSEVIDVLAQANLKDVRSIITALRSSAMSDEGSLGYKVAKLTTDKLRRIQDESLDILRRRVKR